jgi:hypothetical protein
MLGCSRKVDETIEFGWRGKPGVEVSYESVASVCFSSKLNLPLSLLNLPMEGTSLTENAAI